MGQDMGGGYKPGYCLGTPGRVGGGRGAFGAPASLADPPPPHQNNSPPGIHLKGLEIRGGFEVHKLFLASDRPTYPPPGLGCPPH